MRWSRSPESPLTMRCFLKVDAGNGSIPIRNQSRLLRHGVEPFLGASTSSAWSLRGHLEFLRFEITGEPWIGVFSALALVGCFAAIARRQPVLPLWLFALYQFVPRSAGTYAQVLAALLAAIALVDVVILGLERLVGSGNGSSPPRSALLGSRAATWWFAGALVLYGFVADLGWLANPSCPLRAVDVEQRQAFNPQLAPSLERKGS